MKAVFWIETVLETIIDSALPGEWIANHDPGRAACRELASTYLYAYATQGHHRTEADCCAVHPDSVQPDGFPELRSSYLASCVGGDADPSRSDCGPDFSLGLKGSEAHSPT